MTGNGPPLVSVVVATRDRAIRLEGLLDSLRRQTIEARQFEVIVVDDGSGDETRKTLARQAAAEALVLETIRLEGVGPAVARNAGWRAARAALVAFTDDDCEVSADWLSELLAAARKSPGAILQGPTTPIPRERESLGPYTRTRSIQSVGPWYETCNIAYPQELLEKLGGFDERFPEALGEDTELGWRARAAGARLVFAPAAEVHHAVDYVGPMGKLREATVGIDSVLVFKLHPALRKETVALGIFRNRYLARGVLAVLGLSVARRRSLRIVLAAPYAADLARRVRAARTGPWHAGFLIVFDLVAASSALRGAIRHRIMVL